ncbi:hypothetical protein [Brevibacillus dissolubilis]|uniref:hypothetical protein n=1 Tax=Brevibacillus dissolubilis TaxID=1844116 RepID=UPI00111676CB|nr:hypothetical protein [Brevibacillus dissolubilis]
MDDSQQKDPSQVTPADAPQERKLNWGKLLLQIFYGFAVTFAVLVGLVLLLMSACYGFLYLS